MVTERRRKYYWLTWSTGYDTNAPVAYAPEDALLAHELLPKVIELEKLPFNLKLESVNIENNGLSRLGYLKSNHQPADYQPNSLAWPLMSGKMKEIINGLIKGNEGLKWIKVNVQGRECVYSYFIPIFTKKLDTLDYKNTLFVPNTDHIIKAVFDYEKIKQYEIFHGHSPLWQISPEIYISERIKKELLNNQITGIQFEKIEIH